MDSPPIFLLQKTNQNGEINGGKTIKINTSRSRSELTLLKHLCSKNGWKEVFNKEGDLLFSGIVAPEEDFSIATEITFNRIPGMDHLAHKKTTGYFLNKFREYFPSEYDFFPQTFLLPEQKEQFFEYFKNIQKRKNTVFIAKPTIGSEGDGIFIINKLGDLSSMRSSSELVIQEYINNPLILDKRKFDLRVFVLIASVKPLRAFIADEGLARFATEDYEPVSELNLNKPYMHLTNYSLNKLSSKFIYSEECTEMNLGSKRSLTSFWKSLEKTGIDVNVAKGRIEGLVSKFLKCMHPFLIFNYDSEFGGKNNGKCFQLLGFDILFDENLKPWLLEINSNPSLNVFHEDVSLGNDMKLLSKENYEEEKNNLKEKKEKSKSQGNKMKSAEYVKNKMKINAVLSPIDLFVKSTVLEDTILLIHNGMKSFGNIEIGGRFRGFKLVYHEDNNGLIGEEQDIFKILLEIYGKLSGFKFKSSITSGKFVKLSSLEGMTNEGITKTGYDLLFTKVLRNSCDSKNMDFYFFIDALERLGSTLYPKEKDTFSSLSKLVKNIQCQLNRL